MSARKQSPAEDEERLSESRVCPAWTGSPTQTQIHPDSPFSTAECLLRSPWLHRCLWDILQGQGKHWGPGSWRGKAAAGSGTTTNLAHRVLQRKGCGLKLSHRHPAKRLCGLSCPPGTLTVGPGQCGQLPHDGLEVSQHPKHKQALQIIPNYLILYVFTGLWGISISGYPSNRKCILAAHLAQLSPWHWASSKYTLPLNIPALSMSTPQRQGNLS